MKSFTISEWQKAERDYAAYKIEPQRPGSVTSDQYAKQIRRSKRTAQDRLFKMYEAGLLEREQWNNSDRNRPWIYWPKKKKK